MIMNIDSMRLRWSTYFIHGGRERSPSHGRSVSLSKSRAIKCISEERILRHASTSRCANERYQTELNGVCTPYCCCTYRTLHSISPRTKSGKAAERSSTVLYRTVPYSAVQYGHGTLRLVGRSSHCTSGEYPGNPIFLRCLTDRNCAYRTGTYVKISSRRWRPAQHHSGRSKAASWLRPWDCVLHVVHFVLFSQERALCVQR
jgi:hypothetical protein